MLLISIGEIFLKGKNKQFFVNRLLRNVRAALQSDKVVFQQSKVLCQDERYADQLRYVFGITKYAIAHEASFAECATVASTMIGSAKTFRVTTQRRVKVYKPSQEVNKEVGAFICAQKQGMRVDLKHPEVEIFIDLFKDRAYVYTKKFSGLGGLPVGVSGTVFMEVENEKKATVTAFLMMKRGCKVTLSRELPLLRKFEHGFTGEVRQRKPEDVIVSEKFFEELALGKGKKEMVYTPLTGFNEEETHALYGKIEKL